MRPAGRARSRAILSDDTPAVIERRLVAMWQSMGGSGRLSSAGAASVDVAQLALAGARRRAGSADALRAYADVTLGRALAARVYGAGAFSSLRPTGPVAVVLLVVRALDACGVRYVVGGSLASSVAGEPRATLDADLMVDLPVSSVGCVLEQLGDEFYAEHDAFERAIHERTSVNIVHMATATKVDLFVLGATLIEPRQMERRQRIELEDPPGAAFFVYTPEDILLQKLRWFRLGGETSDRQWRDVLGILLVQGDRLDPAYLASAAADIGVADLFARAYTDTSNDDAP
jgi:hypothetical protein